MKFPSVKTLLQTIGNTFLRFPLAIIVSIFGAIIAVYLLELDYLEKEQSEFFTKLLLTSILGLGLFILSALLIKRRTKSISSKIISGVIGLALLAAYYFTLPEKMTELHFYKFFLFFLAIHCFISFAPFLKKGETNGFWQFNKSLFIRILTSALYSAVLYAGLALAMLAVENLFEVSVKGERYGQLWIIIVGIFNTWFFISGIPENFNELEENKKYPKGLKVFTQWILLPLVLLYFIILYVYSGKIIVFSNWPSGWVAYMVLGFSIIGIFSLLLVYPVKDEQKNKWIRIFTRFFYWALIPLIILLFIAIWKRIGEYGITENRYFVFVLAIWLIGITLYQIFTKYKNIKIIPISLGLIALLSSFGPWSAFDISKKSQYNRLISILEKHEILVDGKVSKLKKEISFEDRKDISSTTEYLVDMHGYEMFKPFFKQNLDSILVDSLYQHKPTVLLKIMGIEYINRWTTDNYYNDNFYFSANSYSNNITNISGYNYLLDYNNYFYNYDNNDTIYHTKFKLDSNNLTIHFDTTSNTLSFNINDANGPKLNIEEIVEKLKKEYSQDNGYNIKQNDMTFFIKNEDIEVKINMLRLNGNTLNEKMNITDIAAKIFIKLKMPEQIIYNEGALIINI